jgi:hypothetical protein
MAGQYRPSGSFRLESDVMRYIQRKEDHRGRDIKGRGDAFLNVAPSALFVY